MKQTILTIFAVCCFWGNLSAQLGGQHTYPFLRLPISARATALGGTPIVTFDEDANLAALNPALLNPTMHRRVSFQHQWLFDGIGAGSVGYAHYVNKWNTTLHGGVQYVSYGEFQGADEVGNKTNTFKAADVATYVGAGRQLSEHLRIGANLRFVASRFEAYNATAIMADIAGVYLDTAKRFTATLVLRNAGTQLTTYQDTRETVPYELLFGVSKRLKHLPFRFSVIAQNLQQWGIRYDDPNAATATNLFGEPETGPSNFAKGIDNTFRHLIFNGEFLLGKREGVRIRFGYNHLRRSELSLDQYRSTAGFSAGIGIKINRFRIDYGWGAYHIAGAAHHIGISTDLDDFR